MKTIYCILMNRLWNLGYDLYNWCEDARPGGGFHPSNVHGDRWKGRLCLLLVFAVPVAVTLAVLIVSFIRNL